MTIDKCVLIIDDDYDFTAIVKFVFEKVANWQVLTASDGKEGILIAEKELPDVILLDVIMPEMDGLTIYKLLRKKLSTCHIPVVFASAKAFVRETIKSQIAENVLVITKPLDVLKLPQQLNEICSQPKKSR